ncbi:MAG: NfeD family protein [Oscillospiraceae bacterium]|nr:NfeD family protein [Oscillospiraceae bacterium]
MSGVVFWVLLAAALVVIEISTTQLVGIWFAVGAFFAAFAAFAGAPLTIQLAVFLVISVVTVWVGRPLLVDKIMPKQMESNTERMIGQIGTVREEINNTAETGRIDASGLSWAARSEDGKPISVGSRVLTLSLEGVTLIVKPLPEEETTHGENVAPNNESEV